MIEALKDLVNGNAALVRRGRWADFAMLLGVGDANWIVTVRGGRIESMAREAMAVSAHDFAIRGTAEAWEKFWSPLPPPMHHDISALVRAGKVRLEGDTDLMMAHFLYLKLVLEQLRGRI